MQIISFPPLSFRLHPTTLLEDFMYNVQIPYFQTMLDVGRPDPASASFKTCRSFGFARPFFSDTSHQPGGGRNNQYGIQL
mmetsp:Transcript_12686/g.25382  ORF Transcript_12686/g.25382 Transcript_12686/m.25382 type:complete len:80 (-) Transcript_12686:494-733(-)